MDTYFRMMADRLLQAKMMGKASGERQQTDDDRSELCALMDHIPNAKSVAAAYQQMMRAGTMTSRFSTGDPGRRWLEMEQLILDRESRKKGNRRKVLWMLIVFMAVGIASYFGGVYLLTKGKYGAVQIAR